MSNTSKIKATHKGTCQGCGRFHKLPKGRVSKHGYHVEWSSFIGTCPASGQLPYELSCAFIERCISITKGQIAILVEESDLLKQPATEPRAWFHVHQRGYPLWIQCEIREIHRTHVEAYTGENYSDPAHDLITYGYVLPANFTRYGEPARVVQIQAGYGSDRPTTELECATQVNQYRVRALSREIADLESYIKWQQERATNWKLKPLTPIND